MKVIAAGQASQQATLKNLTAAADKEAKAAVASTAQVEQVKGQITANYGTPAPTETPPAQTGGTPPPDPKPAIGGPADRTATRGVIAEYEAAFEALDVGKLRSIWPTAPRTIETSFDQMRSYALEVGDCDYKFPGENRATVICPIRQTGVTKRGGKEITASIRPMFDLRRSTATG